MAQKLAKINVSPNERQTYYRLLDSLAREADRIETAKEAGREEVQEEVITIGFQNGVTIETLQLLTALDKETITQILKKNGLI